MCKQMNIFSLYSIKLSYYFVHSEHIVNFQISIDLGLGEKYKMAIQIANENSLTN